MWEFSELQSIELKQGLFAQYFAGKGLSEHPDNLKYRVQFDGGIPAAATYWCAENCEHNWGWLFIDVDPHKTIPRCEKSYLLFESVSDAIHFKLQYGS